MAVEIDLKVRLDQVERELSKIPGWSKREVDQAVRAMELGWKKVPAAARKAAQESERAFRDKMMGVRQIAANTFGDVVNDISDVIEVAGLMGTTALASVAVIGGATLAVAGLGYAAYATANGIYEIAYAAEDASKRLGDLPAELQPTLNITESQRESVNLLSASWSRLQAEVDATTVEVGARFAPTVLTANKAMEELLHVARPTLSYIAEGFSRVSYLVEEYEILVGRATRMQVTLSRVTRANLLAQGFGEAKLADIAERRRLVEESLAKVLERQAHGLERGRVAAQRSAVAEYDRLRAALERQEAEEEAGVMANLDRELDAAMKKREDAARQEIKLAEERSAAQRQLASTIIGASAQVLGQVTSDQRALAAIQVAEVAGNAAVAISAALAQGGPLLGLALASTVIGALGSMVSPLLQLAGAGSLPVGGGGAARAPESGGQMQSTQRAEDGTILVISEYKHEVMDRGTEEALRRSGSPLREAVRSQSRRRR